MSFEEDDAKVQVGILMGSQSDVPKMQKALQEK